MRSAALLFALCAFGALPRTAVAQPVVTEAETTATARFDAAADRLPGLLAETEPSPDHFAPTFLAAIPPARIAAITAQLRHQHGDPVAIDRKAAQADGYSGQVVIRYERGLVHFTIAAGADGRIIGLRVTNAEPIDDSIDKLAADLAALPGRVAWGLYRIDARGGTRLLHGSGTGAPMAVGSVFKLAILGALDERVRQGLVRWDDVIRLDRQSVPAGRLIAWPDGSPLTVHSLATMMIAESDNRASDMLLHYLGRETVERFARRHGGLSGPRAFPILSVLEATVLKNPALGEAREAWLAARDEAARRRVLEGHAARWTVRDVDMTAFATGPADIDSIEWFASPDSMARLLGWFARTGSDTARAILAINPGIPDGATRPWDYAGYKGGSEPGVMAMTLLLRQGDASYAASLAWNDPARPVNEAAFVALAARATGLLHQRARSSKRRRLAPRDPA